MVRLRLSPLLVLVAVFLLIATLFALLMTHLNSDVQARLQAKAFLFLLTIGSVYLFFYIKDHLIGFYPYLLRIHPPSESLPRWSRLARRRVLWFGWSSILGVYSLLLLSLYISQQFIARLDLSFSSSFILVLALVFYLLPIFLTPDLIPRLIMWLVPEDLVFMYAHDPDLLRAPKSVIWNLESIPRSSLEEGLRVAKAPKEFSFVLEKCQETLITLTLMVLPLVLSPLVLFLASLHQP